MRPSDDVFELAGDALLVDAAGPFVPVGARVGAVVVDGPRDRRLHLWAGAGPDTPWEVGSVSKGLTGLLVADAVDRDGLGLATTMGELDATYATSPAGTLTVRELVTHRSGLPRVLLRPVGVAISLVRRGDPYAGTTPAGLADRVRRCRLAGRGSVAYSNVGAAVLGNALATFLGTDFPGLLRRRLVVPLGLTGTTADRSGAESQPATGHDVAGRPAGLWTMPGYLPAGGVVSTVADLATLGAALVARTAPGSDAMDPVEPGGAGGRAPGMFWVVQRDPGSGRRMVWHNGETGGYAAFLAVFPDADRAVAVVLDRADPGAAERLATTLVRAVVADGS